MSKNAFPYPHLTPNVRRLGFSFAPNGTGAVDQTTIRGRGVVSVVRNGTAGVFVATLADAWESLVDHNEGIQLNGATTDITVQLGPVDLAAKTVVIRTMTGAAPTDVAANDNNRVSVTLDLSVA